MAMACCSAIVGRVVVWVRTRSFVTLSFLSFLLGTVVVFSAFADANLLVVFAILLAVPVAYLRLVGTTAFWSKLVPLEQQASVLRSAQTTSVSGTRSLSYDFDELVCAYAIGFLPGAAVAFSVEAFVGGAITLLFYLEDKLLEFLGVLAQHIIGFGGVDGGGDGDGPEAHGVSMETGSFLPLDFWTSLRKTIGYLAFLFVTSFVTTGLVEEAVRWSLSLRMCYIKQKQESSNANANLIVGTHDRNHHRHHHHHHHHDETEEEQNSQKFKGCAVRL